MRARISPPVPALAAVLALAVAVALAGAPRRAAATPAATRWFSRQRVDHFSAGAGEWRQRYYADGAHFRPGGPIFLVFGGEMAITSVRACAHATHPSAGAHARVPTRTPGERSSGTS